MERYQPTTSRMFTRHRTLRVTMDANTERGKPFGFDLSGNEFTVPPWIPHKDDVSSRGEEKAMTEDAWLKPLLAKRTPLAICILMDLCQAGLCKGWVYAGDVKQQTTKADCNTIGGVFKILHHFGFEHTDERIKMTRPNTHARKVDKWVLANRKRAEQFIAHQRRLLVQVDSTGNEMFDF